MVITFSENAWEDFLYWQKTDKRVLKKINNLIKDIIKSPFEGVSKPEPLKYDLAGLCLRRIDHEHRIVYQVNNDNILIYACRFHYD